MPKELFGTDGIRGIPGEYPLDDQTLYWTGRSLGRYLSRHPDNGGQQCRVLIGMDTRESGPHIAAVLSAGLAKEGVAYASAGIISTPGVACVVRKAGFSAGVVISASHNPYHDNGVKLFAGSGMKFPDEIEEQLENDILANRGGSGQQTTPPVSVESALDEDYLEFLRGCLQPGAKLAGLKIVLDCANGAASSLGPALFRSLGADVVSIHDQPDGRNINADSGSLHPE